MNGNALSELNPSGSVLILNSYFSLLAHFSYMVIARPINVSVYNCVCVSMSVCMLVCVSGCICFTLLMFQRVTPSLLSTFLLHCSLIIAFI